MKPLNELRLTRPNHL